MSRYQLLRKKKNTSGIRYFKPTKNVVDIYNILEKCLREQYILQADNLQHALLNSALVRLSRKYRYPIVTGSEIVAKSLSISQAYSKVYCLESLPDRYANVVCYWDLDVDLLPPGINPVLVIRKGDEPV